MLCFNRPHFIINGPIHLIISIIASSQSPCNDIIVMKPLYTYKLASNIEEKLTALVIYAKEFGMNEYLSWKFE